MKKIKQLIKDKLVFIKYLFSAGFSFVLDLLLFTVFLLFLKGKVGYAELLATYIARAISSLINYLLNKNAVFKNNKDGKIDKVTITKYYLLVIIQATISGVVVEYLSNNISIYPLFIKIPVECVIFLVNYFVQKYFIFTEKPVKININPVFSSILFAIAGTFSLMFELDKKDIIKFSTKNTHVFSYLILSAFLIYYYKNYNNKYKDNKLFNILSLLFSIFMTVGYSYDKIGSAYLVFGKINFIIISVIKLIFYYKLFKIAINQIYNFLCNYKIKDIIKSSKIIDLFNKHPFIFSSLAIIICYIPYLVAFYPAVMGYDPSNQIREFMGMHTRYMDSVILLDPNVTITNFNPVLHTLLLGGCFKLGHVMGNDNIGLFIYVVIQCIILISTLSYSIVYMKKNGVINKLLFIVLGMYALIPVFPFYAITTNKDTIFCCFILLYCIKLFDLIKNEQNIKKYVTLFIIMLLVTLTRNNGIYTIVLSLPFALIWLKDKRKPIIVTLVSVIACYMGYNKVVLPSFKISNTSIREMLSIPFQQTARLAKYYPKDFSESDKEVIDKILTFDTLGERYNPGLSDPVKNEYNIYTSNEDLKKYFKVWFKGLTKRPDVYIDSTINNIYGYFYPNTSKWYIYYKYNTKLKEAGFDYHYNSLSGLRDFLGYIGTKYPYVPILGLFVNIAFVGWIYFFLFIAILVKKQYKFIPFVLPALSFILVCVAGPANTYFRYALPYVMTLPITVCMLYYVFQENKRKRIAEK